MKKTVFSILISSLISSILSISTIDIYKKYKNKFSFFNKKNENFMHEYMENCAVYPDFTKISKKVIRSVVNVKNLSKKKNNESNNFHDPFDLFFGSKKKEYKKIKKKYLKNKSMSDLHGSGVIISSDGYIVTNDHVVKNAEKINITLDDKRTYIAKLIGSDPSTDIALLKINERNLPFVYFSDSDKVKVGEWVLAIGNPFDLSSTVTSGIISAKNRNLGILQQGEFQSSIESFLQTDAPVNPGNSGGALINTNGELIGINTAISSSSGNFIGYSFAAPSNIVLKVIKDIRKYKSVKRGFIGIVGIDLSREEIIEYYNNESKKNVKLQQGFLIDEVFKNSGAYDAGIKNGDIIKIINGKLIKSIADISSIIGTKYPGDKLSIVVLRKNKIKKFYVFLKNKQEKINKENKLYPCLEFF